jgi:hypothetical protein
MVETKTFGSMEKETGVLYFKIFPLCEKWTEETHAELKKRPSFRKPTSGAYE